MTNGQYERGNWIKLTGGFSIVGAQIAKDSNTPPNHRQANYLEPVKEAGDNPDITMQDSWYKVVSINKRESKVVLEPVDNQGISIIHKKALAIIHTDYLPPKASLAA